MANNYIPKIKLLPNRYRKVGWLLVFASILIFVLNIILELPVREANLELAMTTNMLIGMLILAFTKDVVENEVAMQNRMLAYAMSLMIGVVIATVYPIVGSILTSNAYEQKSSTDLIFQMLWFYFCFSYYYKYKAKKNK